MVWLSLVTWLTLMLKQQTKEWMQACCFALSSTFALQNIPLRWVLFVVGLVVVVALHSAWESIRVVGNRRHGGKCKSGRDREKRGDKTSKFHLHNIIKHLIIRRFELFLIRQSFIRLFYLLSSLYCTQFVVWCPFVCVFERCVSRYNHWFLVHVHT